MNTDFDALFQVHDRPGQWEQPFGFVRDMEERRFRALLPALERLFSGPLQYEDGVYIQDASFHAQVFVPSSALRRALRPLECAVVRFSNFGDMVAVWPEDALEPAVLTKLREVVTAAGYLYVPQVALDRPYGGGGVNGISTWWDRYFDWL
jgi:hypothetical protein